MDDVFLKSALPAQDSFVLEDTSLALPAEPTPRSSTRLDSKERSLRVHQQVQLTLSRKARKPLSNGGVHLQKSTARSFDAADGCSPLMKVNGISNRSLSVHHTQTPCRRVEVSPTPSPELPRARFNYSTIRHGLQTLPGPGHSHMTGSLLHRPQGSNTFQRYAFSEAPRGSFPHASASARGSYRRRSLRQTAATQPVFANAGFHQNGDYSSRWSHRQSTVKKDQHTVQGPNGDLVLSPIQPDTGFSWLAHMRKEGQRSFRMSSYPPSVTSMEVDMGAQVGVELPVQQIQAQNVMTLNSENKAPEMTLERAVSLLSQDNEETLITAASYIQNQCFLSADAKNMMYYLRGIGKLLELLNNDSEEVQRVAAGALRNVVYQSSKNKMEVKESDGLSVISQALRSSRDMETRRQLSGLLWNLSSHDLLKDHLSRASLSVITQSVLVPSSGISEGENPKDELLADNDSFYNATGCLRNLSSAGPDVRRAMRQCENLIDSLVYYIRGTVANFKTDDKSTENCVCILHNLSYQIESEVPQSYTQDVRASRQHLVPRPAILGCFAYRSAKIPEHLEHQRPLLEEKANPHGTEWLRSPITIRMYLSLVACSIRPCTQEAAIGALQNITAGNGELAEAIAFTIVERENGLQHIKKMLEEGQSDVKKTAISLIRNISRYHELHSTIVNQLVSEMVAMLPSNDSGTDLPNEVTTSLLQILINLSQTETKNVKAIINQGALPKVISMSKADNGYGPSRAAQAACVLLHTIWKHSDLHGALRRSGYKKSDFINPRTTKVNSR